MALLAFAKQQSNACVCTDKDGIVHDTTDLQFNTQDNLLKRGLRRE